MVGEIPHSHILRLFRWVRHREPGELQEGLLVFCRCGRLNLVFGVPIVHDTGKLTLLVRGPASNYMLGVLDPVPVVIGQHGFPGALVMY